MTPVTTSQLNLKMMEKLKNIDQLKIKYSLQKEHFSTNSVENIPF